MSNKTNKTKPTMINIPIQDMDDLKLRISTGAPLAEADTTIILSILNVYQWIYVQLESTKLTLHRLTKMLGFSTEKKKKTSNTKGEQGKGSIQTSEEEDENLPDQPPQEQDSIINHEEPPEKKS